MTGQADDDSLLLRLRRVASAVRTATRRDDRRRLLALEAELRAVRGELATRCRQMVERMNAAGAQLGAINAYARCASLGRGSSHSRTNGKGN
ncbi:hypothetical protein HNR60_003913 [Rhodopseudomonas rhenobacensis]|uniref:Uncharacterized protein n=1 Tax=Rhodopseudomonas rhenobacensis TaxID=87461 RepID=A0A7W7Z738_9BRAD|nr:hypothetical protein [Rhodopseudomonas rhenobacensis]MBB5049139.1 hypothetical protein [Rhodopseudomonas rhenobacensis]